MLKTCDYSEAKNVELTFIFCFGGLQNQKQSLAKQHFEKKFVFSFKLNMRFEFTWNNLNLYSICAFVGLIQPGNK